MLIPACGKSEESEQTSSSNIPIEESATTTMQENIKNQQLIEQAATEKLDSVTIEEGFAFATVNMVTIELRFLTLQYQEKISIYSAIDTNANMPINLLEQGTLNQSDRYRSMLAVANTIESLVVVRNDDFANPVTLNINANAQLIYTFEE